MTTPSQSQHPRVGIVHERFTDIAGSEQVVQRIAEVFPKGPIIVPFLRESGVPDVERKRVVTGYLQKPYESVQKLSYAPLLPAVPRALRSAVAREHRDRPLDALVISHHAFAVAAARDDVPTLAYVHSPARWAWDPNFLAGETNSVPGRAALTTLGRLARSNEKRHVPQIDAIVGNSTTVRQRINDWWGREAEVIHPPVNVDYFAPDENSPQRGDYFIAVGRMVPYKRVDIAVRAVIEAQVKLVVIGAGRDFERVSEIAATAPDLIDLKGFLPTPEARDLIQGARALLMPGEEDFGIVPVEATAAGTPVVALGKGGALDSVIDGVTGIHVPPGADDAETVANFADALRNFPDSRFERDRLIEHAATFSPEAFQEKMAATVSALL